MWSRRTRRRYHRCIKDGSGLPSWATSATSYLQIAIMKISFGITASLLAASAAAYPQVLDALPSADISKLQGWGEQAKQAAANPQAAAANPGMW